MPQPSRTMRSLLRCSASFVSSVSRGVTNVGVTSLVSANRSFWPMAILGVGRGLMWSGTLPLPGPLPRLGCGRGPLPNVVCSGFSMRRCSRDTEICRAMDCSTAVIPAMGGGEVCFSSELLRVAVVALLVVGVSSLRVSESADGLVICVWAEEMEDGERLRELVIDEAPDMGSCCDDALTICHLGSWIWGFTDVNRMTAGEDVPSLGGNPSSSISVGDSRMRLDSSALNLGTDCSRDRARVAMVILPLLIWPFG